MKYPNFIRNLSYLILVATLFIGGSTLIQNYLREVSRTFDYNPYYVPFISFVFFGGIGILLGLSAKNFPAQRNKIVGIDKLKLILLGVPSLLVALAPIWVFWEVASNLIFKFLPMPTIIYLRDPKTTIVASLILGHTLISSLKLEQKEWGEETDESSISAPVQ
ncbi:MAG: hypothetical protein GX923_02025 [Clostridia bacterium]|jgi:hypothetical protein|nr:hypothetical protein [Clostridia bacterium]